MSYPLGTKIGAPLTNGSELAKFGTHIDYLGVGGFRSVLSIVERDAITVKDAVEYDGGSSGMRREGMIVYTQDTKKTYQLLIPNYSNLSAGAKISQLGNNANWQEIVFGVSTTPTGETITNITFINNVLTFVTNVTTRQFDFSSLAGGNSVIDFIFDSAGNKLNLLFVNNTAKTVDLSSLKYDDAALLVRITDVENSVANGVTKSYVDTANSQLAASIATEKSRIDNLVTNAPQALDTLKEIADQLASDEAGTAAILATQQQHTQQLANADTITSVTHNGNVLTVNTTKNTYSVDLLAGVSSPATYPVFQDPNFNLAIYLSGGGSQTNGTQWAETSGWYSSNNKAIATNAGYLYQDLSVTNAGNYTVKIVVDSVSSGALSIITTGGVSITAPAITLAGTYIYSVPVANPTTFRFHLFGNGNFTGVLSECSMCIAGAYTNKPLGLNDFVHLTGDETVSGKKNFTDRILFKGFNLFNTVENPAGGYKAVNEAQYQLSIGDVSNPVSDINIVGAKYFNANVGYFQKYTAGTGKLFTIDNYSYIISDGGATFAGNVIANAFSTTGYFAVTYGSSQTAYYVNATHAINTHYYAYAENGSYHISSRDGDVQIGQGSFGSVSPTIVAKNNGNVGIGTAAPNQKLHIADANAIILAGAGFQGGTPTVTVKSNIGKAAALVAGGTASAFVFSNDGFFLVGSQARGAFDDNTVGDGNTTFHMTIQPTGATNFTGSVTAQKFIGDGSQLTNLPISAPAYSPELSVTTAGAQTINLPKTPTAILNVWISEITGGVRTVYPTHYSFSGNIITVTADANIITGDKVIAQYQ